jgi:hypothetical protein
VATPFSHAKRVSFMVAVAVLKQAYEEELLMSKPLLDRIERQGLDAIPAQIRIKMYDPIYVPLVDTVYQDQGGRKR